MQMDRERTKEEIRGLIERRKVLAQSLCEYENKVAHHREAMEFHSNMEREFTSKSQESQDQLSVVAGELFELMVAYTDEFGFPKGGFNGDWSIDMDELVRKYTNNKHAD